MLSGILERILPVIEAANDQLIFAFLQSGCNIKGEGGIAASVASHLFFVDPCLAVEIHGAEMEKDMPLRGCPICRQRKGSSIPAGRKEIGILDAGELGFGNKRNDDLTVEGVVFLFPKLLVLSGISEIKSKIPCTVEVLPFVPDEARARIFGSWNIHNLFSFLFWLSFSDLVLPPPIIHGIDPLVNYILLKFSFSIQYLVFPLDKNPADGLKYTRIRGNSPTEENGVARSDKKQSKHDKMTKQPVEKLIVKLAIPTIVSMLVSSFYNLVDTVFVGRLEDENSTAAVSVVFSLMAIIQAFGFFCGHGSGNYISRALGRKETEKAERMAATGFFLAGGIGALILLFGLLFLEPFALLLGSKEGAMLVHTEKYMFYILIAAPVMCMSLVLNNQLRYQGNAVYAMAGITSGAVLNIGLDAWLVPKVGVEGAAIATMISQFVSFGILLTGMLRSDSLRIRFRNFTPRLDYFKEIVIGGTPSLCRQGLGSICTVCINTVAGHFGDAAAIAAIGIVQRFMMFVSSATIGFGQGFQPVCGFNYGAGLYDRVRRRFGSV